MRFITKDGARVIVYTDEQGSNKYLFCMNYALARDSNLTVFYVALCK